MWILDGPKFVRFASRLPLYNGAVKEQITRDYQATLDEDGNPVAAADANVESKTVRKMSDLMGETTRDNFDALNQESMMTGGGSLFERVVA